MNTLPHSRSRPRHRQPELEHDHSRPTSLGYEDPERAGLIRCLAHGFPTPLARWHFHDEYELHLITQTSGKAFIGDWIGAFQPGHLVLCGPRLPHNWVSLGVPEGGVAERDLVIQFRHEPIEHAAAAIPELADALPLLARAAHGIEFFGISARAAEHFRRVRETSGVERFAAFCAFLAELVACRDYRLLSSVQIQGDEADADAERINAIVDRLIHEAKHPLHAADVAAELGMSESRFSRFFRRATGNSFTDFVNRVRVNRACHLLMETDARVTHICYEVGFHNVANFNRRFRDIKGMTPSEFRQQAEHRFAGAAAER